MPPESLSPEVSWKDLLDWGEKQLASLDSLGSSESRTNAEWLLEDLAGIHRHQIYLEANPKISSKVPIEIASKFRQLVAERKKRIPLAYLTGKTVFWKEVLEVNPACLIPRPETEILIEKFIEITGWKADHPFTFLDLGTGSGAMTVALLRYFEKAQATLSDISEKSLEIARKNLDSYKLLDRAELVRSDLFENCAKRRWDAILSNPPYLAEADWKEIQPELLFEPREALDGGKDGLHFYRRIASESKKYLSPQGWLMVEVGQGQAEKVGELFLNHGFKNIQIFKDHSDIKRVVTANG